MTSDEIRERYLSFFEGRDHKRIPSGSLVPAEHDPSVLLTTAGMHPLKPYFQGREKPPHHRLTSCQKCFRTPDIDQVGMTTRHLTFFEMLGNFSIGDYFKQGAAEFAWELSLEGFGFNPEDIWATVFEGDEELGLGPDQEAIDVWLEIGVPRERIVGLPRSENFWQAGPTGPCGPCSELYLDRGLRFGKADDLPGGENERFLEYWNLVFMQYEQEPVNTLTPLPAQNIDTGLGLNRLAAIMQGVDSVFDTDQFTPLIRLGEELSGKRYGGEADRALRVLADHTRGMSFLIADGVVPSNEDRGYVLRRLMRRAIVQARQIGIEPGFLPRYAEVVRETMGKHYAELLEQADTIDMWLRTEEETFNRTLEQGMRMLEDVIERAKSNGEEGIGADEAFRLHDTFGFPFDLTLELAAERGLGVDEQGFESLMEEQRVRARASAGREGTESAREKLREFATAAGAPSIFTGYETTEQATAVAAVDNRKRTRPREARRVPVLRHRRRPGPRRRRDRVRGRRLQREGRRRRAGSATTRRSCSSPRRASCTTASASTPASTATRGARPSATTRPRTSCTRRCASASAPTCARPAPTSARTSCASTSRTASPLSDEDRQWIEDRVNRQILENLAVRALTTTLDEARSLGAMALFGEKYGDVVRMVEVGDGGFSRELCGGTHVRSTAEIGVFKITQETSSAANVRRIEAITGPLGVEHLRKHDRVLREAAVVLRTEPDAVAEVAADRERKRRELEKQIAKGAAPQDDSFDVVEIDGIRAVFEIKDVPNPKALPDLADRFKNQLGDPAVVVLGAGGEGRASLLVAVTPGAIERGVKAGAVVKVAAAAVGGGGGGRDNMAQAGGRDPDKLPDALAAARAEIERALAGSGA